MAARFWLSPDFPPHPPARWAGHPRRFWVALLLGLLVGASLLGGCAGDAELEIIGSYQDEFDATQQITAESWETIGDGYGLLYWIGGFSNVENYLVAQNDSGNSFNPDLFSRFEWTISGGTLYYCQFPYAAETAHAARDEDPANATDPAASGCGDFDFPWTRIDPI